MYTPFQYPVLTLKYIVKETTQLKATKPVANVPSVDKGEYNSETLHITVLHKDASCVLNNQKGGTVFKKGHPVILLNSFDIPRMTIFTFIARDSGPGCE